MPRVAIPTMSKTAQSVANPSCCIAIRMKMAILTVWKQNRIFSWPRLHATFTIRTATGVGKLVQFQRCPRNGKSASQSMHLSNTTGNTFLGRRKRQSSPKGPDCRMSPETGLLPGHNDPTASCGGQLGECWPLSFHRARVCLYLHCNWLPCG